jgi:hypothetical protein
MKKITPVLILIFIFTTGFIDYKLTRGDAYLIATYDGIDKRIIHVKKYLQNVLSNNELNALSFSGAVIHAKDSAGYFVKVPFKDKKITGFFLVKKERNHFKAVQINIKSYHLNDSVIHNMQTVIEIESKDKKLRKKCLIDFRGRIQNMYYPKAKNAGIDTIYSVVPLILNDGTIGVERTYINTNLIFDDIDSLNNAALTKGVIIHDLIPLAFKASPSVELEFGNWTILKPVNLDSMLRKFNN